MLVCYTHIFHVYRLGFAEKEPQSMLILRFPSTLPVHFSVYQLCARSTAANECSVSLEGSEFGSSNCARRLCWGNPSSWCTKRVFVLGPVGRGKQALLKNLILWRKVGLCMHGHIL